jgi:hypothetical protein
MLSGANNESSGCGIEAGSYALSSSAVSRTRCSV